MSGDGEGDDESIYVALDELFGEEDVHSVAFVLTSFSGHAFGDVEEAYFRLLFHEDDEIARMTLHGHPESGNVTVMTMCHLIRNKTPDYNWVLHTLGIPLAASQAELASKLADTLKALDHDHILDQADSDAHHHHDHDDHHDHDHDEHESAAAMPPPPPEDLEPLREYLASLTSQANLLAASASDGAGGSSMSARALQDQVEGLRVRAQQSEERLVLIRESQASDVASAEAEMAALRAEKEELEAQIEAAQSELDQLAESQTADTMGDSIDDLDEEVESLKAQLAQVQNQVREAKEAAAAAAAAAEAAVAEASAEQARLCEERERVSGEIASARAELEAVQNAEVATSNERHAVEAERSGLSSEAEELSSLGKELRTRKSELEVRQASLTRERAAVDALASTVSAVRADTESLRNQVSALEESVRSASGRSTTDSSAIREELELLSGETLQLHRRKRALEDQLTMLTTKGSQLSESERLVAAHKEGNETLRAQIADLEAQIAPKETQLAMLEHTVALQAAVLAEEKAELEAAVQAAHTHAASVHSRYMDASSRQAEIAQSRVAPVTMPQPPTPPIRDLPASPPHLSSTERVSKYNSSLQQALENLLDATVELGPDAEALVASLPVLFRGVDHIINVVAGATNTALAQAAASEEAISVRETLDITRAQAGANMANAEYALGSAVAKRQHTAAMYGDVYVRDAYGSGLNEQAYVSPAANEQAYASSAAHSSRVFETAIDPLTPTRIHDQMRMRYGSSSPPSPQAYQSGSSPYQSGSSPYQSGSSPQPQSYRSPTNLLSSLIQ